MKKTQVKSKKQQTLTFTKQSPTPGIHNLLTQLPFEQLILKITSLMAEKNMADAEFLCWGMLKRDPRNISALFTLANIATQFKQHVPALALLEKIFEQDSSHHEVTFLAARCHHILKNYLNAIDLYKKTLQIKPDAEHAAYFLGKLYHELSNTPQAIHYLAQISDKANYYEDAQFILNTIKKAAPDKAPTNFISLLFDEYAQKFDHHLVNELGYKSPAALAVLIKNTLKHHHPSPEKHFHLLDLGCGTGLGTAALKDHHIDGTYTGIDLSKQMIKKAKEKKLYHQTHVADIEPFLREDTASYDIIFATDVFVYIGKLDTLFEHVKSHLKSSGLFAFSIELDDTKPPYHINKDHLRYTHARSYIETLSNSTGFTVHVMEEGALRSNLGSVVKGLFCVLQKNA